MSVSPRANGRTSSSMPSRPRSASPTPASRGRRLRGGREQVRQLLLDGHDVTQLDHARGAVDRGALPPGPGVGVVVGHHPEQGERLVAVGGDDDAPPELVDADGPQPWVASASDLLQVQAGVGGVLELAEDGGDLVLHVALQAAELPQEVAVDPQSEHGCRPPRRDPRYPPAPTGSAATSSAVSRSTCPSSDDGSVSRSSAWQTISVPDPRTTCRAGSALPFAYTRCPRGS